MQKEIGLVGGVLIVSALEFILFAFLFSQATNDWLTAAVLVVISVIWIALMAIALAIVHYKINIATLVIVPTLIVIALSKLSVIAIGGGVLLSIFLLMAQRTFAREVKNRIQYRTVEIFSVGTRLLLLGCMIGLLGLSWTTLTGENGVYRVQVSEQQLAPLMKPLEPLLRKFIPNFRADITIDEFIQEELNKQAAQLPPGASIPPEQLALSRAQLSEQFGEQLSGQETVTAIVTRKLNNYIGALTQENVLLVTLVLIIIAFLTLRALVPLLVWPLLGIIALLVLALRAVGVLNLQEVQVTTERLTL